jgi:diguanylate cyclase (GGDEF)-like protein
MLIAEEVAKATGQPIETLALRSDGSTFPVESRARDLPYQGRLARVVSLRDISEARAARAKIHRLSNYDPLTGLANRELLREQLRIAISAAQRRHCFVGVLCINLDNFKAINTLLGNEAGDRLLQFVAGRIKLATRSGDTIGRTAGDEFGVVLDGLNGTEDAVLIAQRAIQAMEERFEIDGQEVFTSVSIGIAIHPLDGDDADSLLRNAMSAMQRAKEKGGNSYEFFTAEINKQAARRFEIETHLRRAIERSEFVLHYQPKVSLRTGQLIGAEALIRWQHPTRGVISPLEFIPLAEKSGLIVPIGEWVLQRACADMRRWDEMGLLEFPVSINLSLRQLRERDLGQSIAMALDAHGLPPSALELELTESSLADNVDLTANQLRELDALGIVISIDDFGTGYSSLSYLRQYPVRTLKVDRSFVRNLPDEPGDAAIARSVVALAGGLGIKSVAEGVETVDQLNFLIGTGYDAVQGYLISKPLAAEDFVGWLKLWLQNAGSIDSLAMHPLLPRFGQLASLEKGRRL